MPRDDCDDRDALCAPLRVLKGGKPTLANTDKELPMHWRWPGDLQVLTALQPCESMGRGGWAAGPCGQCMLEGSGQMRLSRVVLAGSCRFAISCALSELCLAPFIVLMPAAALCWLHPRQLPCWTLLDKSGFQMTQQRQHTDVR